MDSTQPTIRASPRSTAFMFSTRGRRVISGQQRLWTGAELLFDTRLWTVPLPSPHYRQVTRHLPLTS